MKLRSLAQSRRAVAVALLLQLAGLAAISGTRAAQAEAAPAGTTSENPCVEQFRSGRSAWVECYGAFETDSSAQEELANLTFELIKGARCSGTMRVRRAALTKAVTDNGVLELDPQDILCVLATSMDASPEVVITLAPKITFRDKRALDVSPRLLRISSLPEFLTAPLRSGAESAFVRKQLVKELNRVLEQAFPR